MHNHSFCPGGPEGPTICIWESDKPMEAAETHPNPRPDPNPRPKSKPMEAAETHPNPRPNPNPRPSPIRIGVDRRRPKHRRRRSGRVARLRSYPLRADRGLDPSTPTPTLDRQDRQTDRETHDQIPRVGPTPTPKAPTLSPPRTRCVPRTIPSCRRSTSASASSRAASSTARRARTCLATPAPGAPTSPSRASCDQNTV